jgi:Prealbumin-like fold domain
MGRWIAAILMSGLVFGLILAATNTAQAANPSANLDQCANGSITAPDPTPCQSAPEWVNGNLGASKAHFFEGDSIPYRIRMDNLSTAIAHTITIEWDTTKSGKHALDYITTFDRSVPGANPCVGVAGCNSAVFGAFAIPQDPQVPFAQIPGQFQLYGGTINSLSAYSYPDGTGFTGDKSARITITFHTTVANPVLAWGGHIATRANWGTGNSAVNIPGSPYHTRLVALDGSGGNQDRSLSAEAVIFPSTINIVKHADPPSSTSFSYTASPAPLSNFSLTDNSSVTDATQTFTLTLPSQFTTYTVVEGDPSPAYALTALSCVEDQTQNSSTNLGSRTATIVVDEGELITCTYTNTQQAAHLIVIKHVINDNGGTAVASDFTMTVTGNSPSPASFPGAESPGTDVTLQPGAYSVSESGPSGYTESDSADCSGSIAAGETKTCTITNDDQAATLVVTKHVVNNNGGTAVAGDFTMSVTATNPSPASFAGDEAGTTVTLDAGSYSVSETNVPGYTESDGAGCSGTIANGETKYCTITNNDQAATLIVIKHVINDDGGTAVAGDFTLDSGGTNDSPDDFAGEEAPGTTVTLDAGSYDVSETGPSGYTESDSADCSGSIANGETKTCTVTNDDQAATLIVIKHVINNNGGTAVAGDFTMSVTGSNPSPASFAGEESPGTSVGIEPGSYSVSESGPSGYTESDSADCTGSIALGETKTCTITNDDQAATLIVIKHVINDDGGIAVASDFTLDSGGTNDSPDDFAGEEAPGTTVTLDAGSYDVSETGPSGYTESDSADCSGSIANGETKTCTVTNDDIAPPVVAQITPTATTCDQFKSGTADTLSQIQYSVKSNKINQTNPGVFFYWVKVTTTGGLTIFTIDQEITTGNFSTYFAPTSGSAVFDGNCVKVASQLSVSNGDVTVRFNAPAGTYFIGIKYTTGTVVGQTAPNPSTVHYTFETTGVAGSNQGLDLVKKA